MFRGQLEDTKLSEEHLLKILEAGRQGPSGHNSQPWEFIVIDDPEVKRQMAEVNSEAYDRFISSGDHLMTWWKNWQPWVRWSREELERSGDGMYVGNFNQQEWETIAVSDNEVEIRQKLLQLFGSGGTLTPLIAKAPCLILTVLNTEIKVPDHLNDQQALTSVGAAMQNMRLAAYDLGIRVGEQSRLYDIPESRAGIKKLLNIPDHYNIVGAMRAGYRSKQAHRSVFFSNVRRPLAEMLHYNIFAK